MKASEFISEEKVRLDPKCWTGKKIGNPKTKVKGGVRVNNCVPAESVGEAANPAQQAAIAIAKKKEQGVAEGYYKDPDGDDESAEDKEDKKDNEKRRREEEGVAEDLTEEFDLIESIIEGIAAQNGVDAEVVWADLESLTEDELYAFAVTSQLNEDWQKANKRDRTDGMSQKAVNAYRRENPGSKLKTAVTTKPSKLKKGGKASKRRKSYCSRSRGQMKMHSISCAKTPDKAICKARRRWNC